MSRSKSNLWLLVTEWPEKEGEEVSDWTFKDNQLKTFVETCFIWLLGIDGISKIKLRHQTISCLSGSSVFIGSAKEDHGKNTQKDQNDKDVDGRNEIIIHFPMVRID